MPSDEKLEMAFGTMEMRINSPDKINVSLIVCCFANITINATFVVINSATGTKTLPQVFRLLLELMQH